MSKSCRLLFLFLALLLVAALVPGVILARESDISVAAESATGTEVSPTLTPSLTMTLLHQ